MTSKHNKIYSQSKLKEYEPENGSWESTLKTLIKAGVHLGHYETHAKIRPYLYGQRAKRKILNLKLTFRILYYAKIVIDDI